MASAMQRYPMHLVDLMQLADGCRVVVRPVLSRDFEMLRGFVRSLSDEARYFRFMTGLAELPEAMVERFTRIDYLNHVGLIAEVYTEAGPTMIADARYIVDQGAPTACEFAIAVADDWQGMGLAHALLARLAEHAASRGIRCMTADTVSTNKAMIRLARRNGFRIAHKREDGRLVSLFKELEPHEQRPATSGSSLAVSAAA